MTQFTSDVSQEVHKKLAVDLFNFAWDLMETSNRTETENETMIHAAHASRFHWGLVGTPLNFARGEWQISRVYSLLGRAEPALYHARKSLELCLHHQFGAFDLGFAYEALARAYGVMGDTGKRDQNIRHAKEAAVGITEDDDRGWLLKNIDTL